MAVTDIQRDFIEGVHEVYATMFTDGVNDGVYFYPLYEPEKKSVYREVKYKQYLSPILLVAKVTLTPEHGEEDVKSIKERAEFKVTYKSLVDNEIDVSNKNLVNLRKGLIRYKDTFYEIDNISPTTFVEDVFLAYVFECTEEPTLTDVVVYSPPVEEPEKPEEDSPVEGEENV